MSELREVGRAIERAQNAILREIQKVEKYGILVEDVMLDHNKKVDQTKQYTSYVRLRIVVEGK